MTRHRRHHRTSEAGSPQANPSQSSFNLNGLASLINSIDVSQLMNAVNNAGQEEVDEEYDIEETDDATQRRDKIVNALRTLINSDKAELLQTIIQLYATSKTQRK